jgi:hypothetical protein
MRPRTILGIGWIVAMLYAYPGYMSYDSVWQLAESRTGVYGNWHPPVMAQLWRIVELVVAGPVGMLAIQLTCFLAGAYLLFRHVMRERTAATCAAALLVFPPVLNTMSVIWKDAQMAGWLMLGIALLLDERRKIRIAGLVCFVLGTGMRHNALAMTGPLVFILFEWRPGMRWWKRYAISFAAWVAVTASAQLITKALTQRDYHLWASSMALLDMTGTLRYAPDIPDAELHADLEGVRIVPRDHLQDAARATPDPTINIIYQTWNATNAFFKTPTTDAERAAVSRAWRKIVLGHPAAYMTYRWHFFRELLQLTDSPIGSPVYFWFNDVQDIDASATKIDHDASISGLQREAHIAMDWLGGTLLFTPYVYFFLAIVLLGFCWGHRVAFALLASGLCGELGLYFAAPTTDQRYSFWLIVGTLLGVIVLIAERARRR